MIDIVCNEKHETNLNMYNPLSNVSKYEAESIFT